MGCTAQQRSDGVSTCEDVEELRAEFNGALRYGSQTVEEGVL